MQPNPFNVSEEQAREALNQYREHRNSYDPRDWEIERIYRAIARGKTIISVHDAIRNAGVDAHGRPKLAIARADAREINCQLTWGANHKYALRFTDRGSARWGIEVPFIEGIAQGLWVKAETPRIPPQYRPPARSLKSYHVLFEAEWTARPPADPFLLRRLGEDAWIVLAAWELTEVELSVLRAHQGGRA